MRRDGRSIDPEIEGGWKHRGCGAVEALRHELGIGRVSGLIGAIDSMNSSHSNGSDIPCFVEMIGKIGTMMVFASVILVSHSGKKSEVVVRILDSDRFLKKVCDTKVLCFVGF